MTSGKQGEPATYEWKRYEQYTKALFEHHPDVMWWMDTNGSILSSNSRIQEITGFPKSHFLNQPFSCFVGNQEYEKFSAYFLMAKEGVTQNFDVILTHKEGHPIELHVTLVPVTVDDSIAGVYGIGKDGVERKKSAATLQEADEMNSLILEHISDGFLAVDSQWRITYWNMETEKLTGIKKDECIGKVLWSVLPHMIEKVVYTKLHKAMYEQVNVQYEFYYPPSDRWYLVNACPFRDGISLNIHNNTSRKKAEQQVVYMTYYDSLTGLPNRILFIERLNQALREKDGEETLAVLVVDLDRFTAINDMLGYYQGDHILTVVSKRLSSCVREIDMICRNDSDAFSVLLRNVNREQAELVAKRIINEFQTPIVMDQQKFVITPSIGISLQTARGASAEDLLRHAETAMRKAKENGKSNFKFCTEEINTLSSLNLAKELRNALIQNELTVFYQPQVNIRTGKVIGAEALVRWHHPKLGMVSPAQFIPVAEQSGLIVPLGEWVLKTACAQNKAWQNEGLEPITVSVNLSPLQFTQSNILEVVKGALEETKLEPRYLDLEITEGMTIDLDKVLETLKRLKELGVRISMDDFGQGYSSLYYLKHLPLDTLKIDQSFVRDCTFDESDAMIVKTIISMAHHLKLNVIAEGVETKEQLVFLQQHLCDEVQGYLFSKPLPPEEFVLKLGEIKSVFNQYGMDTELSEQKWMEEQLRSARQDLEDTIRKQQGMTFKFREENGRFIHTLCDGELLYRIKGTPEQIIGKELYEIFPKDQADRITESYRKAWQGESNVTYETSVNGIWLLAALRPITRGGKVVEVIGNCIDITERKLAETALTESEERYRQLIEMSPDIILVHDHGEVLFVNQAGYDLAMKEDPNVLTGKRSIYSFLSLEEENESEARVEKMILGEKLPPTERRIIRSNGEVMYLEVSAAVVLFKGKTVVQSILRDITERKRQEEALKQLNEQYKLIAENMSDLIAVFDRNMTIKYISPSHETVLGYPISYYNEHTLYDLLHPDDEPAVTKIFADILTNKTTGQIEFRYRHRDGSWIYLDLKGTPALSENGEIDHIITVSRDVTEKRKIEGKMRERETLAAFGELAAVFAHEIRNPITSIQGFIKMMKSNQFKPEYYDFILSEIKQLELKVEEVLQNSKQQ